MVICLMSLISSICESCWFALIRSGCYTVPVPSIGLSAARPQLESKSKSKSKSRSKSKMLLIAMLCHAMHPVQHSPLELPWTFRHQSKACHGCCVGHGPEQVQTGEGEVEKEEGDCSSVSSSGASATYAAVYYC